MEFGVSTVTAYFVMERTIDTMSTSWTPSIRTPVSRFRSARFTCPERTSMGTEFEPRRRDPSKGIRAHRARW